MACEPAVLVVDPDTCAVPRLKPSWLAVCTYVYYGVVTYIVLCTVGCVWGGVGEGGRGQVSCVGVPVQADTY